MVSLAKDDDINNNKKIPWSLTLEYLTLNIQRFPQNNFLNTLQAIKMKIFTEEYLPFMLEQFQFFLKENQGGNGYFVGVQYV